MFMAMRFRGLPTLSRQCQLAAAAQYINMMSPSFLCEEPSKPSKQNPAEKSAGFVQSLGCFALSEQSS